MSALDGISIRSKIALIIAATIMFAFFVVQTCVVFEFCPNLYFLDVFGYICVIAFMPPFFLVVKEFLDNKAYISNELSKKNIYLEHAAKIIRHDMHSGINTYLPRGIASLKRRITQEDIDNLKIQSPLKLIEDGLDHARKVYSGVYEFTNLVKNNAQLTTTQCNIKDILNDYLRLTAYKPQVILDNNLPIINVNEALFCTAIDNLIRNGLKYNDSPTKWVKIYYDEYLYIEDNGRGMTNDEFKHLSKPYVRKEGQQEDGTGLGLNITIAILKEHGFKVSAEKTKQGTKIKIEI
jgi:signal transduction histidine kinase